MGRRDRRELASRLTVLLSHLLKWWVQPGQRSASWLATIGEQRWQISRNLADTPSLRPVLDAILRKSYPDALDAAARETGMPVTAFPQVCPFQLADVLSSSFLPE